MALTPYTICRCSHQARSHGDGGLNLPAGAPGTGTCLRCRCRAFREAPKSHKPKRSSLRKRCDDEFSRLVRARDKVCQMCGSEGPLDCAHFIGRSRSFNVRWNPLNAAALCRPCHTKFDQHELDKVGWIMYRLGDDYNTLRSLADEDWDKSYSRVWEELKAWKERVA